MGLRSLQSGLGFLRKQHRKRSVGACWRIARDSPPALYQTLGVRTVSDGKHDGVRPIEVMKRNYLSDIDIKDIEGVGSRRAFCRMHP